MNILLMPPLAFLLILAFCGLFVWLSGRTFSIKPEQHAPGECESYACGESSYNHMVQPEYTQFFPFAFFFTIAHVVALIMTTVPVKDTGVLVMAVAYMGALIIGLFVLLRK